MPQDVAQENIEEQSPAPGRVPLEEYELTESGRPPYYLTVTEVKLLGIAGVGFFLDGTVIFFRTLESLSDCSS